MNMIISLTDYFIMILFILDIVCAYICMCGGLWNTSIFRQWFVLPFAIGVWQTLKRDCNDQ